MSEVTIPWSTGSRSVVVTEGLRHIVIETSVMRLVYGNHYETTIIGPGHMGRQIGHDGWKDAATALRILTGLSLMKEVHQYPVMTGDQARILQSQGLSSIEDDAIIVSCESTGWKSYWYLREA